MLINSDPRYSVLDGFLLDTTLRCNLKYRSLAVQQFEALRRSGAYRAKLWPVPEDSNVAIPAFNAYELQIRVVPGTAIWGFMWTQGSNAGPFSFNFRDSCTDVKMASEVIRTDTLAATDGDVPAPYQQTFPRLLVFAHQGLIHVQICSQQTTDATGVQLVLCGGEPSTPEAG